MPWAAVPSYTTALDSLLGILPWQQLFIALQHPMESYDFHVKCRGHSACNDVWDKVLVRCKELWYLFWAGHTMQRTVCKYSYFWASWTKCSWKLQILGKATVPYLMPKKEASLLIRLQNALSYVCQGRNDNSMKLWGFFFLNGQLQFQLCQFPSSTAELSDFLNYFCSFPSVKLKIWRKKVEELKNKNSIFGELF